MKVEITKAQLQAITDIVQDIEGMVGGSDDEYGSNWDVEMQKRIKLFDRFLKKNGYTRK